MHSVAFRLLNEYQRGFPLVPRPFLKIATQCDVSEERVIHGYRQLQEQGSLGRIGAVFRPNTVGASALAALAVPPEDLARVAESVSAQAGVNHNYEREHRYNLWFVVTAPDEARVGAALDRIESACGLKALRLPLEEEFHIDLGFDLTDGSVPRGLRERTGRIELREPELKLVAAIEQGLPLLPRPYLEVGRRAGLSESQTIESLRRWLERGVVRRLGVVVRHRPLGYRANAMVVWNIPDWRVPDAGRQASMLPMVTLCYRRARQLPDWPYNLFCMVHGKERAAVERAIEEVTRAAGLEGYPREVLFSRRCFAQRGARYAEAAHG